MESTKIEDAVKQQFSDYLRSNKLRSTPERHAILNAIYTMEGSFDIETLLSHMEKNEKFHVSRATVYNTIALLINANLVIHHQFAGESRYEKCFGRELSYAICTNCKKVTEIKNIKIKDNISNNIKKLTLTHYSLYVYGLCSKCMRTAKRRNKRASSESSTKKR
ncbi:MAG: transcriptional repressor [Bacteroidaceae bacterium]|nr:transcriptional repressor [Bacteroidaceae bacterium]